MVLANLAFLQTESDTAKAQRALAVVSALANGLDVDRLLIYRQAVQADFYNDDQPHRYVPFICGPCPGPHIKEGA